MVQNYQDVFSMSPLDVISWLHDEFYVELPERIETPDDMVLASRVLLVLSGYFSYLSELLAYAKVAVRQAKRNEPKEQWEDMVDRQVAIERKLDSVKQQYTAVSRAVTIKTEKDKEFFMSSSS